MQQLHQTHPLFAAIRDGDVEYLRSELDDGLNADTIIDDTTLLYEAIHCGSNAIVKLLLENSANPNLDTDTCCRPLSLCAICNNHEAAQMLVDFGVDVNAFEEVGEYTNFSAIRIAVYEGSLDVLKMLVNSVDIDISIDNMLIDDHYDSEYFRDLLHDSIYAGRKHIIEYLVLDLKFPIDETHIKWLIWKPSLPFEDFVAIGKILLTTSNMDPQENLYHCDVAYVVELIARVTSLENELQQWKEMPIALSDAISQFARDVPRPS